MKSLFLKYSINYFCKQLKRKKISPEDLLKESFSAIKYQEKKVQAWICFDHKKALKEFQSQNNNTQSSIYGIPFGIKDTFNTYNFPTQMGSKIWKGFTPGNDARVVDSIKRNGAIAIGKTVTAEFAVHSLNKTKNPHNAAKTPGTSSSGSAAAVATGMVPFALGSQTAGSISRPASFCGVWGMKPSFGLIPRTGILKTTDSLDTVGFLTTHGENLRPILDAARVYGPNYPFVYKNVDKKNYCNLDKKEWKIAFIKTHTWENSEEYVKDSITNLANKISGKGKFEIKEIQWPKSLYKTHAVHDTIYKISLAYYFQKEYRRKTELSSLMSKMINEGKKIPLNNYHWALDQQLKIQKNIENLLKEYDFAITCATSSSAPLRKSSELPDSSLIWTLGHVPCVVAPNYRCPNGMPFGVQFIAKKYDDYLLLRGIEKLIHENILQAGSTEILN